MVARENYANTQRAADSSGGSSSSSNVSDANSNSSSNTSGGNNEQIMAGDDNNINTSSSSRTSSITITTTPAIAPSNIADDSGGGVNDNHNKLILKLPKNQLVATLKKNKNNNDDDDEDDDEDEEEEVEHEKAMSSKRSKLSTQEDTRKVEPLKINLLQHTTTITTTASSMATNIALAEQQPQIPKITIKPIFKENTNCDAAISSDCSSSAEESEVRLKLHNHHHVTQSSGDSSADSSSSPNSPHEQPHILPKLTIRSANNEDGTTVVPKLTIKMSDANSINNNAISTAAAAATTTLIPMTATLPPPPPLPKLTIKTTQDGSSGSIISSLLSSSSSAHSSTTVSTPSPASASSSIATVSTTNVIPKLTIKTSPTGGACVSSTENNNNNSTTTTTVTTSENELQQQHNINNNKIPKLMIKTGQEHAMIITQHTSNDVSSTQQSIPKLTIKTKLFQKGIVEDIMPTTTATASAANIVDITNDDDDNGTEQHHHEKIPKLTIKTTTTTPASAIIMNNEKTNATPTAAATTTTTIHVTSPKSPQQQLKVRHVQQQQQKSSPSSSSSPERVPKLMISRQQDVMMINNNHHTQHQHYHQHKINSTNSNLEEKLLIKSNKTNNNNNNSLLNMMMVDDNNMEKVPKLTIKNLNNKSTQQHQQQQILNTTTQTTTCEEINNSEIVNINKTIPKLTIKNLCSPKLKMKAVLEDNNLDMKATTADSSSSGGHFGTNGNEIIQMNLSNNDSRKKSIVKPQQQQHDSDDMDIDEELTPIQSIITTSPATNNKLFNNLSNFNEFCKNVNNKSSDNTTATKLTPTTITGINSAVRRVIDTVDLTSSPDGSPAHSNYLQNNITTEAPIKIKTAAPLLLERLQRDQSVIQTTSTINKHHQSQQQHENSSFLLHQLNAPLATLTNNSNSDSNSNKRQTLSPTSTLHARLLQQQTLTQANKTAKYPHLTERLMANGIHASLNATSTGTNMSTTITGNNNSSSGNNNSNNLKSATVIDSIEILDTPDGSSRSSMDEAASVESMGEIMVPSQQLNGLSPMQLFNNHHMKAKKNKILDENLIDITAHKLRRLEHNDLTNKSQRAVNPLLSPEKCSARKFQCNNVDTMAVPNLDETAIMNTTNKFTSSSTSSSGHHRSRKQKHEHLLTMPVDEDPLQLHGHHDNLDVTTKTPTTIVRKNGHKNPSNCTATATTPVTTAKKRGRPKKVQNILPFETVDTSTSMSQESTTTSKTRRVQLLRKRLAIDMVTAEQPFANMDIEAISTPTAALNVSSNDGGSSVDTPRRDRPLRTPVRVARNNVSSNNATATTTTPSKRGRRPSKLMKITAGRTVDGHDELQHHHFGGSNSSLSSGCSSSSMSSTTITTTSTRATTSTTAAAPLGGQIDLTMCSSSSSVNSYGQQTTTAAKGNNTNNNNTNSSNNSMLPPSKILSSSDPVPDVIFKPNDFSSILVTQQLRANASQSFDNDFFDDGTCSDNSADSGSMGSTISLKGTPGSRGRGRGRGSRGGAAAGGACSVGRGSASNSGRGTRGHRLGRGASAVAKAIAMSRPRCVGGLKHMPDPKRLKGLLSPSPQVFEEDTRMSADLTQQQQQHAESMQTIEISASVVRQLDFLNNDESQSSVVSNTSILDPNTLAAIQGGVTAIKQRPKKKKMEICVAEDTEFTVGSIAEYDWPPPKGCCPSKNRDTFMIQEQVALYLGIKSFKRKYPDLPRRQIDMEERNWLQEKGLVTEKMCDLGITAVWASDILDIMYADFYDKYEEYKDYVRQKHLREIEVKQKALGISILGNGRGLQTRERALLSASKFNSYFTRVRRSERVACLDLQSLTVNVPAPASAPASTLLNRHMAQIITEAAAAERIAEPPTLLQPRIINMTPQVEKSYPLALMPGQFSEHYRCFTPLELSCLPLQTALADVCQLGVVGDADNEEEWEALKTNKQLHKRYKRLQRRTKTTASCAGSDTEDSESSSCSKSSTASLSKKQHIESPSKTLCASSSTSSSTSSSDSEWTTSSEEEEENNSLHRCGVCQRAQNNNLKQLPELFIKCYTCCREGW